MADAITLEKQMTSSSDKAEERTAGRIKFSGADPDPIQLSDLVTIGAVICTNFVLVYQMYATFDEVLSSGVT